MKKIFNQLISLATNSHDREGVVIAALVRQGQILVAGPSADDSVRHAEDMVLEKARAEEIRINDDDILFTTVEPCSRRSPDRKIMDCTTLIIAAGIKQVLYAVADPYQTQETTARLAAAGIKITQISAPRIENKAREIFNSTQFNPNKRKL